MAIYDVIFTDAGFSGSNATEKCAISGLKMILPEKEKLQRDKPCGRMLCQSIKYVAGIKGADA